MTFLEVQFPPAVSYGVSGGPVHATGIVVYASGHERRNRQWSEPLGAWDAATGIRTQEQLEALVAFFRAVDGRANGFRYKDWNDFRVAQSEGRLGAGANGSGLASYALYKRYSAGGQNRDRRIAKPVAGSVTVYRNDVAVAFGAGAGQVAIDATTGVITFVADASKAISGITQDDPGVVHAAGHGFSNGTLIYLSGIGGMTELNGELVTVTSEDADHFSIGVDTSGFGAYTSGGTAKKYPQPSDTLEWAGEFDVPARFDTDAMRATLASHQLYDWGQIPVREIRLRGLLA